MTKEERKHNLKKYLTIKEKCQTIEDELNFLQARLEELIRTNPELVALEERRKTLSEELKGLLQLLWETLKGDEDYYKYLLSERETFLSYEKWTILQETVQILKEQGDLERAEIIAKEFDL